jgi:hypothetical protein
VKGWGAVADSKSPIDQLVDAFVFAPLGLLREWQRLSPRLADDARAEVEQQIRNARVIGQFAVKQGRVEIEKRLGFAARPVPKAASGRPEPAAIDAIAVTATAVASTIMPVPSPEDLPIADYDFMAAAQLLALLSDLNADELDAIERYEKANRKRKTVLGRIGQLRS